MKTIRQIANELGVSKQAVQQKIKKEPLSTNLKELSTIINGVIHINVEGEELIKSAFIKKEVAMKLPENFPATNKILPERIDSITRDYIDNLLKQIEILTADKINLQTQLTNEKEYNRSQTTSLQNKIINQSDRITDLAEKLAELTRNSQILLKQEQDKATLLLPEQSETVPSEPFYNKVKRPFWNNLFNVSSIKKEKIKRKKHQKSDKISV